MIYVHARVRAHARATTAQHVPHNMQLIHELGASSGVNLRIKLEGGYGSAGIA